MPSPGTEFCEKTKAEGQSLRSGHLEEGRDELLSNSFLAAQVMDLMSHKCTHDHDERRPVIQLHGKCTILQPWVFFT